MFHFYPSQILNNKQKIILVIFGIIVAIVFMEIILRVGGMAYKIVQEFGNQKSLSQKGTYKIMCIGESTTAGGKDSYPRLLEGILNQKSPHVKFSVINKGEPGRYSTTIVKNLKASLDQYQPDMVIVMMGINDIIYRKGNFLPYPDEGKSLYLKFFHSLRIYKLFQWMFIRYKSVDEMEAKSSTLKKDDRKWDESIALSRMGDRLKGQKKYLQAEQFYNQAIQSYPGNMIPYMLLAWLYTDLNDLEKLKSTYELAISNNSDIDWGYAGLSHVYELLGNKSGAAQYREKSRALRNDQYNNLIKFSFLKIKDMLNQRKVKLVCMQYPLRDLESLRKIFSEEDDILFIDNEAIFLQAVSREGYSALFKDNFAGDFGHCTLRGNHLLANNVADKILNYLQISITNDE